MTELEKAYQDLQRLIWNKKSTMYTERDIVLDYRHPQERRNEALQTIISLLSELYPIKDMLPQDDPLLHELITLYENHIQILSTSITKLFEEKNR